MVASFTGTILLETVNFAQRRRELALQRGRIPCLIRRQGALAPAEDGIFEGTGISTLESDRQQLRPVLIQTRTWVKGLTLGGAPVGLNGAAGLTTAAQAHDASQG